MTALENQDGKYNAIGLELPNYYMKQYPILNRCAGCNFEYGSNTTTYPKNIYCYRCKVSMSKVFNQVHILVPVSEIDEITLQKKELEKKKALEEWKDKEIKELEEIKQMKIRLHKELKEERMILKKRIKEMKLENALNKYRAYRNKQKQDELVKISSQPPMTHVTPKTSAPIISKQEQMKMDLMEFINAPKEQQTTLFRIILQKEIESRKKFSEESNKIRAEYNPGMTDFSELDYMTKKFNVYLHVGRMKDLQVEQKKLYEQIVANSIGEKYDSNITIDERKIIVASLQIHIAVDKLERDGRI